MELVSERLIMRSWRDGDRAAFAAMSADPEVARYLTLMTDRAASDAWIDRQRAHEATHGYCFWAVEERESGQFAGSIGLLNVGYQAAFTPAVELGWRLPRWAWGRGYAPEAARVAMRYGFESLGLAQIVANTAVGNLNSRRVMVKLGLSRDPADDFDHPRFPDGHTLQRQVLYRIHRADWERAAAAEPGRGG